MSRLKRVDKVECMLSLKNQNSFETFLCLNIVYRFGKDRSKGFERRAMAKKPRQVASEPSSSAVTSRDTLQRLNYLYQASVLLATAIPPSSYAHASTSKSKATLDDVEHKRIPTGVGKVTEETASEDGGSAKTARRKKLKHRSHSERSALPGLSRMMVKTMREVAKKAVVRMCVPCSLLHVPRLTMAPN